MIYNISKKQIHAMAHDLAAYLGIRKAGDSKVVMSADETYAAFGEREPLYATVIEHPTGKALMLHWPFCGEWFRSMILPENTIEDTEQTCRALDLFFN